MRWRDVVALKPTLYGRMVLVTECAGQRADAAMLANKLCVIHTRDVHTMRTPVNVECVSVTSDNAYMPGTETTGEALSRLRARSGLSMAKLARAAGYSHASGVQRYLAPEFDKRLPLDVAEKLADAMTGRGTPVIDRDEIFALAGLPVAPNAQTFQMEGASEARMVRDVPIYGTALGAEEIYDGEAVEQTMLNTAEVIGYLHRPVLLNGRADVYGIYVQGSSMNPRHRDGATLFVESRKRPSIGDDAVIYLRMPDEHDGERPSCVLVKTLVKKSASFIELEQYNPHLVFRIPADRVARMDRVITLDELVA